MSKSTTAKKVRYKRLNRECRRWTPHSYQKRAIRFMLERMCAALFLDPGLGKTSIVLGAFKILKDKGMVDCLWVIAPMRVAHCVWPSEVEKWADFNHFKVAVLHGPKKEELLRSGADIFVINPEGLNWLFGVTKKESRTGKVSIEVDMKRVRSLNLDRGMLAVDESTRFKNTASLRFKTLRVVLPFFRRRYPLTGTPTPNGLMDLFGQMYIVDLGKALGQYITHYRREFFIPSGFGGFDYKPQPKAMERILERIAPNTLRMKAEDYLELPDKVVIPIYVELPPDVMAFYKKLERDMIVHLRSGEVITAVHAGAASNKCIAEGTEVLTSCGWKPIEEINSADVLWDGVEWINTGGSHHSGFKPVVECCGVKMTPDHKVLTQSGWRTAQEILDGESSSGYDRLEVRIPDDNGQSWEQEDFGHIGFGSVERCMCVWEDHCGGGELPSECEKRCCEVLWLQAGEHSGGSSWDSRHVVHETVGNLERYDPEMQEQEIKGLGELRGSRYSCLCKVVNVCRFLGRYAARLLRGANVRARKRERQLHEGQLPLGHEGAAEQKYEAHLVAADTEGGDDSKRCCEMLRYKIHHALSACEKRQVDTEGVPYTGPVENVYDILDAGPRHRFTVRGSDGRLLLVHNCRQVINGGIFRDAEFRETAKINSENWLDLHEAKVDAVEELLGELNGAPLMVAYEFEHDLYRLKKRFPKAEVLGGGVTPKRSKEIERAWNDGQIQLLLAQPAAVGHGLNLQECSQHVCWHSNIYDFELEDQFNKRVLRQGNKFDTVFVYKIVVPNTLDELILEALERKDDTQTSFLDNLKRYADTLEEEKWDL